MTDGRRATIYTGDHRYGAGDPFLPLLTLIVVMGIRVLRAHVPTALILLLAVASACSDNEPAPGLEPIPLERGTVYLQTATDTFRLEVEIADSDAARAYGLMDRDELDVDAGMLFIFEEDRPGESGFYMYRTRIPLDAAFADSAGTIVAIRTMEPCSSPVPSFCTNYAPGFPYRFVLEVNAGYLEARGITVGDGFIYDQ